MPDSRQKILVFIPTYNDFGVLNAIIDDVSDTLPDARVLVVDDGSHRQARIDRPVLYVRLPFNLGLGASTHIAMDYALDNDYDILLRVDADGQHPVSEAARLVDSLQEGADVVVASRENRDAGRGLRNVLSRIVRRYLYYAARITTAKAIPLDINSGFMAMSSKAMQTINEMELERYPEPQIVMFAAESDLHVREVGVTQKQRQQGVSTLGLWAAMRLVFRVTVYAMLILVRKKVA
ncbi:MAG: glycosyltransferase family 2 protein [Pseudomonadota bacterium]|nr:MAG: glycosyltransferase family 2 protein [Pseudomonadota bacterium]